MIVDKTTSWAEFEWADTLLTDAERRKLEEAAVREALGGDGFVSLTIREFFECLGGSYGPLFRDGGRSVFDVYAAAAFVRYAEGEFMDVMEALTLKPTAKETAASRGCKQMGFEEATYVSLRHYFGLHSFEEVDRLKVADWLIAKKDTYNKQLIERNQLKDMKL